MPRSGVVLPPVLEHRGPSTVQWASRGALSSIPHDGASTAETAPTGDSMTREQDVVEQRVMPSSQTLSLTGFGTGWSAALRKVTSAAPIHGYADFGNEAEFWLKRQDGRLFPRVNHPKTNPPRQT